jgi:hypothetical protein
MKLRHYLSQLFRSRQPRAGKARPSNNKPPARLWLEPLEDRTLPSAFNLGTVAGATFREDNATDANTYQFTLAEPAVLDIQTNSISPLDLLLQREGSSAAVASVRLDDNDGFSYDEVIHLSVPADTYILTVTNLVLLSPADYSFVIAVDLAAGQPVEQNGALAGFRDDFGRELGALTEEPGHDFTHD